MYFANRNKFILLYYISFTAVAAGVVIGTLYYIFNFWGNEESALQINSYINSLKSGMDIKAIIKSSIKTYAVLFLIIYISSYFKLGYIASFFWLGRKGFINAFTISAMLDAFGINGLILSLSNIPQAVILLPVSALFSSSSYLYSKNKSEFDKKEKFIYIIFSIIVFTIFCICALTEGVITTTFMKWVAYKVT